MALAITTGKMSSQLAPGALPGNAEFHSALLPTTMYSGDARAFLVEGTGSISANPSGFALDPADSQAATVFLPFLQPLRKEEASFNCFSRFWT